MALNKIDNQIKEKLNAREIQPSAPAWDRLDAMLTVAETQQAKRNFTWLYIAASFLLFFGLGLFLLNSNEAVTIENTIPVVTNEIIQEEIQKSQLPTEKQDTNSNQTVLVQNKVKSYQNQTAVVVNRIDENREVKDELPTSNFQLLTSSYKYLSPEELLADLRGEVKKSSSETKTIVSPKITVDANSLLSSVEKELDENHRESTLNKLGRKFNDLKSVLANRNYE
jgi:hypothetical protein